jgi:hypothetical protein
MEENLNTEETVEVTETENKIFNIPATEPELGVPVTNPPFEFNLTGDNIVSTISIPAKDMAKFADCLHRFLCDSGVNATLTRSSAK